MSAPPCSPPPDTPQVLIMVYAPCHMLVIGIASLFLALPTPAASSIVLCSALLYSQTYVGDPGHSGARPPFPHLSTPGAPGALPPAR